MTKFVLQKTPLAMALLDLRFTALPEKTIKQGLEAFKSALFQQGFSDSKVAEINQFELAQKSQTEFSINQNSAKRFDFIKISKNQGVTLTCQSLTLRTTVYECFESFQSIWNTVLDVFFESFPDIENAGMQRLGLRHMDAFIPSNNDPVTKYINSNWLSPQQVSSNESSLFFIRRYSKTNSGMLRVEIEERRPEGNIINVFPKDILDPEPVSLLIDFRSHWQSYNGQKYAIVDIDHAWQADKTLEVLTKNNIESKLQGLYQENSDTFWSILSEYAEKKWEKVPQ